MTPLRLTGPEIGELQQLLAEAFSPQRFEDFLLYRLDKRLHDLVGREDDFPTALRRVIQDALRKLWWQDLLVEARNAHPTDPGLQAFAGRFGAAPTIMVAGEPLGAGRDGGRRQLELRIKQANSTFDLAQWRRRLGAIEGRVCRVECPDGVARGTGFLVGPDTVLTNYHVLEDVVRGEVDARRVALRFDHKTTADGVAVQRGTVSRLAADWLVDASLYSAADLAGGRDADPAPHELDYVLLTTDGEPGREPVGGETPDPETVPRGWIETPVHQHDFARHPALYIVQHPEGRALQVALDTEAVLAVNGNGTRVRYTTTTAPGSSGSPCFDADWNWVAVHHSGDPKYWRGGIAAYNQGIPVAAIRALAAERGVASAFGG